MLAHAYSRPMHARPMLAHACSRPMCASSGAHAACAVGLLCALDLALASLRVAVGGQTGNRSAAQFVAELQRAGFDGDDALPLVQAGGVGDASGLQRALEHGYAGVQVGTRFLATDECRVTSTYKRAIVNARSEDIVWTNKLAGVPRAAVWRSCACVVGARLRMRCACGAHAVRSMRAHMCTTLQRGTPLSVCCPCRECRASLSRHDGRTQAPIRPSSAQHKWRRAACVSGP